MLFTIDKQSVDELKLMGKFRHDSVYHLFNKVKTRDGEKLLDNLFKSPLTDASQINERAGIFRFFESINIQFPFDPEQVLTMREYVESVNSGGKLYSLGNLLIKRSLSTLIGDDRYKKIIQGLQATISILKKCRDFTDQLDFHAGPYNVRVKTIKELLSTEPVAALTDTDIYQSLSLTSVANFDHLIRNKLNAYIRDVLLFIAEADVFIAVSQVSRERGFNYAQALPASANTLQIEDLRHPSMENAVGNNLHMNSSQNVLFLTGANMAGKSTWMKSIAIGVYLAHIGFPVPAKSMQFSVREGIFSSINVADNIGLGYSHFYAEVVRVKEAAKATSTGKHLLVLFDELFKGTNVKDAYDGTLAVTKAFADYVNCFFVVSTHIIEVGEALKKHNNIQFRYMPTIMENTRPRYTYKLEEGITQDRQGMLIIKNEGILELIAGE
jgi:Mismatch repair ATPase (MutS family)